MSDEINAEQFQTWLNQDPFLTITAAITALTLLFLITRNIIARSIIHLADRAQTKVDDILVKHLKPLRTAWLAPFIALSLLARFSSSRLSELH